MSVAQVGQVIDRSALHIGGTVPRARGLVAIGGGGTLGLGGGRSIPEATMGG